MTARVAGSDREAITAAIRRAVSLLDLAQEATGSRMRRAGKGWRGPCPLHGDSNSGPNFSVDPTPDGDVFHCFVCSAGGSVFDFVMTLRRCSFVDARRELAARAGIALEGEDTPAVHPEGYQLPTLPRAAAAPTEPAAASGPRVWSARTSGDRLIAAGEWRRRTLAEGASWREPRDVYTALRDALPLDDLARTYLTGRGLDPERCYVLGVRSIVDWRHLGALLDDLDVCPWEQAYAGLDLAAEYVLPDERVERGTLSGLYTSPAFLGPNVPCLAFFYRAARGAAVSLRLRAIQTSAELWALGFSADRDWRYLSLRDNGPVLPWGADALLDLAGHDLHVTEGELDALTLRLPDYSVRSIGMPGATSLPGGADARWLVAAGTARRIVLWYDADRAGDQGAPRFTDALQRANGWTDAETARRVLRVRTRRRSGAKSDPNTLHQEGRLARVLADAQAAA